MIKVYDGFIKTLSDHDVFVFGSNLDGFHGAGAAGFATFGVTGNQWRKFDYGNKPAGWQGRWTVKGIGEGFQQGTHGWSYAIPTIVRPGARKSLTPSDIKANISTFYKAAKRNPAWRFLVAFSVGNRNLNGYSSAEMVSFFSVDKPPSNVVFERRFSARLYGDN
jgi:hypothetical protein